MIQNRINRPIIYKGFKWSKGALRKSKLYYLAQNSLSTMITKYLNFHGLSTKEHIQMYTRSLKSIQITDKHNHTIIHASQRWVHKNVGNYRRLEMDMSKKLLQYFSYRLLEYSLEYVFSLEYGYVTIIFYVVVDY